MKQKDEHRGSAPRGAGNEPKRKRADDPKKPEVLQAKDPSLQPGTLKRLGGSSSDDWNSRVANDTVNTLWVKNSDEKTRHRQMMAAVDGLIGINPRDELEGMMAAQLAPPPSSGPSAADPSSRGRSPARSDSPAL